MSITVDKRPLWAGRALALIGIVLVGLSMRFAVGALSPLIPIIRQTDEISQFSLGLLGWLAPFAFAVGGYFTPRIERAIGIERTLTIGLIVMAAGSVVRSLSGHWQVLALGTFIALLGTGVINVAMPPAVRKYFPDRIGGVTSTYVSLMAFSAMIAPLIAVPVAHAVGWQFSLAQWGIYTIVAVIPWAWEYLNHRKDVLPAGEDSTRAMNAMHAWRSPTAWAVGSTLIISSITGYACYGWLPVILHDIAGMTPEQGGFGLAIFAAVGLPVALVIPLLAKRFSSKLHVMTFIASGLLFIGYMGLILSPANGTWLWITFLSFGCLQFPLSMVMINLRTESVRSSMGLSGFVQIVGYSGALVGLILMTGIDALFGSWMPVLIALLVVVVSVNVPIALTLRRNRTVDAELAERLTKTH